MCVTVIRQEQGSLGSTGCVSHLMEQNGKGVQEVVIAALKDVYHTDQAAAHVAPHLHLDSHSLTV